jgi:methionyl-tRNA formyltransferase
MKLVFLGSGAFGIHSLDAVAGSSHEIAFIVTQPAQPAGRGRKLTPTPVAQWAKEHSVQFVEAQDVNAPGMVEMIANVGADLILVAAFGQKIGKQIIEMPPAGIINIHGSVVPKYRGAAPINWAIIRGERRTGVSIIRVVEKMDAGDILGTAETDIGPDETAGQLHDRLSELAAPLICRVLDEIAAGTAIYTKQDHSRATPAPKLKKSDGFVDFSDTAENIRRRILGLWPWPGVSAVYTSKQTGKCEKVIIAMAREVESANPSGLSPGTLDEYSNVTCGRHALKILKIKPIGGHLMDFKAFVNGRHTRPGDVFTRVDDAGETQRQTSK